MVWIVVALVLALAVGPLLWLRPSKRDKLVSRCRQAARRAGLVVELAHVPKLDATASERVSAGGVARDVSIECAAYRLPLPSSIVDAPRWRLLKDPAVRRQARREGNSGDRDGAGVAALRENRYVDGWRMREPPRDAPPAGADYWQRLAAMIDALPGGCVAVEADSRTIAWLGQERVDESDVDAFVADIGAGLTAIAKLHEQVAP